MATEKRERKSLRIDLTPQQVEAIREMGVRQPADWVEVYPEELEDRVLPGSLN